MHGVDFPGATFLYNPDLSGDVIIVISAEEGQAEQEEVEVRVPGFELRDFILGRLRDDFISRLEEAEGDALVSLLLRG